MFDRILKIMLPVGQSAFLWGARQTGKSSFLRKHFPSSPWYDLLETTELARLTKNPALLREEILSLKGGSINSNFCARTRRGKILNRSVYKHT